MIYNEQLFQVFEELAALFQTRGDAFRSKAYQKAAEVILSIPENITEQNFKVILKGKAGLGAASLEKVDEFIRSGTLEILEKERNNPLHILCGVYGIGPKKSKELVEEHGITSISQLRANQQLLNDTQRVGLQFYEDILERIPRSEIDRYEALFRKAYAHACSMGGVSTGKMEVVGSFRRGAQTSGDIDVILTCDDPNPVLFAVFITLLVENKVILHVLSKGDTKCLVITRLDGTPCARRVDFLFTSASEYPFALLYFTGSKAFNTSMRHVALNKGLTMNEHGLCRLTSDHKRGAPVNDVTFRNEADIFRYLGLEYKEPWDRIDGRSIVASSTLPKGLREFQSKGVSFLESLTEQEVVMMVEEANQMYYNGGTTILLDTEYDVLKEYLSQKYPSNPQNHQVGSTPSSKSKVQLPYYMGSMDKIKPDTDALSRWMKTYRGPYALSCKLDGVSGLYVCKGGTRKLYTRGDGTVGQDISHLIPFLKTLRETSEDIVVRGEFILSKQVFAEKYKDKFANARNMVAGLVNNKTVPAAIEDLLFVAYEIIEPQMPIGNQLEYLSQWMPRGACVQFVLEKHLSNDLLSNLLQEWRQTAAYEIDGIIVADAQKLHARKAGQNPEYAFAFKMVLSDQVAEAKVLEVLWTPSKDGYLKPRVHIEPISLCGVTIEYATGFNGAFIESNKIGVGCIVELVRSGDVIPHIQRVIAPSSEPMMPSVPYVWNKTHVDVLLESPEEDETVKEKNITGFFRGIHVEGLSTGNIRRLLLGGYDTVGKILRISKEELMTLDGFKEKSASKLVENIKQGVEKSTLVELMAASNAFGRGLSEKKLETILEAYPDILQQHKKTSPTQLKTLVSNIKGMGDKSAETFVENLGAFHRFVEEAGLASRLTVVPAKKVQVPSGHALFGKTIVMSGFRSTELEARLKEVGAKMGTSVSGNTSYLLVRDKADGTQKLLDAKKHSVPVYTPEEFVGLFHL